MANVNRNGEDVLCQTLIDNFFINTQSIPFCRSGLIQTSETDHYPVFLSFQCNSNSQNIDSYVVRYRTIDSDNICKFKFDFNTIFLDSLSEVDAPRAFELFQIQFQDLYNKHFPIIHKTVTRKSLLKPWITSTLANRIKIKDKLGLLSKKKVELTVKSIWTLEIQ